MRENCANAANVQPEQTGSGGTSPGRWIAIGIAVLAVACAATMGSGRNVTSAFAAAFAAMMCWRAAGRFGFRGGFAWRLLAIAAVTATLFELYSLIARQGAFSEGRESLWVVAELAARFGLTTGLYLFVSIRPDSEDDEGFTPTAIADLGLLAMLVAGVEILVVPMLAARNSGLSVGELALLRFVFPVGAVVWLYVSVRCREREIGHDVMLIKAACLLHALYLSTGCMELEFGVPTNGILEFLRWAAVAAAAMTARPGRPRAHIGERSRGNRELAVAALATATLVLALGIRMFTGPGEMPLEIPLLTGLGAVHAGLMLFRQAMVQLENHDLALILRRESQRLRMVLDNIDDAVVTDDPGGVIQFANRRFFEMFRIEPAELPNFTLRGLTDPDDRKMEEQASQSSRRSYSEPVTLQYRGRRTDGSLIYLDRRITPIYSGKLFQGTQSVVRDVSQQSLMARSQRAMAQRLEFFVSKMPLGCIIWDVEFAVQEWNESAARIFGWTHPEVFYRRYCDFLVPPGENDAVKDWWKELVTARSTSFQSCENFTKHRGLIECEWFHTSLVDDHGEVVAVASMVQDVTERKSLERQLVQSQKMEALGTLAGGVAHDFNNLLTTILGQISLALMRLPEASPVIGGLRDAETACERAAEVAQQLLRFGRKSPVEMQPVSLDNCVREIASLLERTIDRKVELQLKLQPDLWLVQADPTQIEQVVMNLCVNARDAINESGRITIEAANEVLAESNRRPHPDAIPGKFVRLSVIDAGCGMSEATRARIFEPFFTTKHPAKGTGLGLAMVYAIVRNHRGWVEVFSKEGRGSAFHIYLPRARGRQVRTVAARQAVAETGVGTILLADDEAPIRALARFVLEQAGYRVVEAADGVEAIDKFEELLDEIDVALLDVIMPRESGWKVARCIRKHSPSIPIVFSSGYTNDGGRHEGQEFGNTLFLPKPYKPGTLLATVRQALSIAPAPACQG